MKINPEKLTVNNVEFIVELCESLRAYHNEQYCDLDNSAFMRKYHEGRSNAYASVLDMFEVRGIIEEKNDGQNSID